MIIDRSLSLAHHNLVIQRMLDLLIAKPPNPLENESPLTAGQVQQALLEFGKVISREKAEELAAAMNGDAAQSPATKDNGQAAGADRYREIFDSQSPELQDFMLRTSVLPEMDAELCNRLLEIDDAQAYIQAMADHGLLGDPTFAEFLRGKLRQDQERYRRVCVEAARTLVTKIRSRQAIDLYLQAHEWEEAARLLEMYGTELYDRSRALKLYEMPVLRPGSGHDVFLRYFGASWSVPFRHEVGTYCQYFCLYNFRRLSFIL